MQTIVEMADSTPPLPCDPSMDTASATVSATGARRFPLVWLDQFEAATETRDFAEDLLTDGALSVIYGESNSGKTFLATDIGLHVALGRDWFGKETTQGAVIYLALEGGHGIRNRVSAFKKEYQVETAPFAAIMTAVDMLDPHADIEILIATINEAGANMGMPVRLVIVDTLSRALSGGDENSSQCMGALVQNADRIREQTGAHVCFIHHSGKDSARGARGHSLLRAATDTEIEVSRDHATGTSAIKVTKQRDLAAGADLAFTLKVVELGVNHRGKPITSCVVEAAEASQVNKGGKASPAERKAIQQLENLLADEGETLPKSPNYPNVSGVSLEQFRERLSLAGITSRDNPASERSQWSRLRQSLVSKDLIGIWGDHVWLVRQ